MAGGWILGNGIQWHEASLDMSKPSTCRTLIPSIDPRLLTVVALADSQIELVYCILRIRYNENRQQGGVMRNNWEHFILRHRPGGFKGLISPIRSVKPVE